MDTPVKWTLGNTLYTITIIITVSGIIVGAYWNVENQINAAGIEIAGYKARLETLERLTQDKAAEEQRFAAEMRTALQTINNGIADLRVEQAKRDIDNARGRK